MSAVCEVYGRTVLEFEQRLLSLVHQLFWSQEPPAVMGLGSKVLLILPKCRFDVHPRVWREEKSA